MPALPPAELVSAITNALADSGYTGQLASPVRNNPRRFIVAGPNAPLAVTAYIWTLTFGGRANLRNEYRIQMTSVASPLELGTDGPTVLVGYEPELNLFAGFDLQRHRTFTTGSPSVQIDREELRRAETEGLSFHRKSNDEIAVGIRPDMFMAYAMNAQLLHRYGRDANVFRLLNQAVHRHEPPPPQEMENLSTERQRVVSEVSRLSRDAAFRQRVLFAYGNRCAVTRVQLRLVDAAHILPVGAPGSSDHVRNGLALAPTYHRVRRRAYLSRRTAPHDAERRAAPRARTGQPRGRHRSLPRASGRANIPASRSAAAPLPRLYSPREQVPADSSVRCPCSARSSPSKM